MNNGGSFIAEDSIYSDFFVTIPAISYRTHEHR